MESQLAPEFDGVLRPHEVGAAIFVRRQLLACWLKTTGAPDAWNALLNRPAVLQLYEGFLDALARQRLGIGTTRKVAAEGLWELVDLYVARGEVPRLHTRNHQEELLRGVWRRCLYRLGHRRLILEADDEARRFRAHTDGRAVAQYLSFAHDQVLRWSRTRERYWRVPGFSPEELADEVVIIVASWLRNHPGEEKWASIAKPGQPTLRVLAQKVRDYQRGRRRLAVAREVEESTILPSLISTENGDETVLERELQQETNRALAKLEQDKHLTPRNREYLQVLKELAWTTGKRHVTAAEVARRMGVHRSNATRQFKELAARLPSHLKDLLS